MVFLSIQSILVAKNFKTFLRPVVDYSIYTRCALIAHDYAYAYDGAETPPTAGLWLGFDALSHSPYILCSAVMCIRGSRSTSHRVPNTSLELGIIWRASCLASYF